MSDFRNERSRGSSAYFCVSDEVVVVPNERLNLHILVVKKRASILFMSYWCACFRDNFNVDEMYIQPLMKPRI